MALQQCGNCFGRFTKSQRLDPENLARSSKDSRGIVEGETVPLNKSLETSSSNEMENNGSNSRQQRSSSSASANHRISEIQAPAENEANRPYVNHGTRCLGTFMLFYLVISLCRNVALQRNKLHKDETFWSRHHLRCMGGCWSSEIWNMLYKCSL